VPPGTMQLAVQLQSRVCVCRASRGTPAPQPQAQRTHALALRPLHTLLGQAWVGNAMSIDEIAPCAEIARVGGARFVSSCRGGVDGLGSWVRSGLRCCVATVRVSYDASRRRRFSVMRSAGEFMSSCEEYRPWRCV